MLNNFRKIIKKICDKHSIKYTLLSKDWIIMLEKKDKIKFISGCKFPLNDHSIGEVIDDKYALYDALKAKNIRIVEHNILYSTTNKNDYALDSNSYDLVKEYFKKNNNSIVVKPNKGTCGIDVYNLKSLNDIDNTLNKLFYKYESISYCPFYEIKNEYRIVVLNNNIELIYKKNRPIVIGNGKARLKDLLLDFNYNYFKDKLDDKLYNKILKNNEKYEYNWKFNLSTGSVASFDISDEIKNKLKEIVSQIINTFHIGFASIDIIETKDDFLVLEINSGVMLENLYNMINDKKIIENIYEKAILLMFKD